MANNAMTPEQVKSTIKTLDESPSCYDTSSKVYGMRKMPSGGRSSAGNEKESGLMAGKKGKK